ncbi:hypothetical protein VZT92_012641 [Zoarces viviparus]|uniref:Uncharacterized protein n=1 Tax=Zoarces viviparus TaxID=48416 RepID=A0AAW1F1N8_ZOAVI
MKGGWICCRSPHVLPPLYVPSLLPSIAHHWNRVGSAAARVVMTDYGSACCPCCFQGHFIQARERNRGAQEEQLYIIRREAQDRKYYLPQGEEPNHHLAYAEQDRKHYVRDGI